MPRMLFEEAAAARTEVSFVRRGGVSVPASVAVHAVVLVVFLLTPLLAPVMLPRPPSMMAWVTSLAAVPAIDVPRPRRPARVEAV